MIDQAQKERQLKPGCLLVSWQTNSISMCISANESTKLVALLGTTENGKRLRVILSLNKVFSFEEVVSCC